MTVKDIGSHLNGLLLKLVLRKKFRKFLSPKIFIDYVEVNYLNPKAILKRPTITVILDLKRELHSPPFRYLIRSTVWTLLFDNLSFGCLMRMVMF